MRIIDADELKALRELYIQGKLQFIENEYDLIDKCPTIDAEPVRHGQWVKRTGMMPSKYHGRHSCSICGYFVLDAQPGVEELSEYCPNCGAKMDLKE